MTTNLQSMSTDKLGEPTEAALALENTPYIIYDNGFETGGSRYKAKRESSGYNADLFHGRDLGDSTDWGESMEAIRLEVCNRANPDARRAVTSTPKRAQGTLPGTFTVLFSPDGNEVLGVWEDTVERGEDRFSSRIDDLSSEVLLALLEEVTQKGLTGEELEALRSNDESRVAEVTKILRERLVMAGMPNIKGYLEGIKGNK